jgi:hypothetical protein
MTVNLTAVQENGEWAVYLPAISSFYTRQLGKVIADNNYYGEGRIPAGIPDVESLNWMHDKGLFKYKWGLYSAGHSNFDLVKASSSEEMVFKRDREKTIIVGDSGGFQIAKGVIKLDWTKIMTPEGDEIRENVLRWLEHTADWSMTLDVPAFAIKPENAKKTGLTKFQDTLDVSMYNLAYFIENRIPGKTKFLNVMSGTTIENSRLWYDSVKVFSDPVAIQEMGYDKDKTLEGYAFAGTNMRNMYACLERLLMLRRDGLLEGKDWFHFLGVGRLDWACHLTSIQRCIRKWDNENVQFSFDAASPFVATAYGLCYNYNYFMPKKFNYTMDKAIDDKSLKGSKLQMPFQSPVMDQLRVGDICCMGLTDTNKNGKVVRTSWDTLSYIFYMAHNVYNHISAVQEANKLADMESERYHINWRDWTKDKKTSKANDISVFIPSGILFFRSFVEELFDPKQVDPFKMLEDNKAFLDSLSFGATDMNVFSSIFDVDALPDEDKFADLNDEKIVILENDEPQAE